MERLYFKHNDNPVIAIEVDTSKYEVSMDYIDGMTYCFTLSTLKMLKRCSTTVDGLDNVIPFNLLESHSYQIKSKPSEVVVPYDTS